MGNMYKKSAFLILHCSVLLHSLNGEAKVITPAQSYNVDGYHAARILCTSTTGAFFTDAVNVIQSKET